jgi:pimeloyl-ACP methyl ester carboxylesterase
MPIHENTAVVNGIDIHYAESGSGELVIFLHGFPEFWYAWRKPLEDVGSSCHAVAVDMRGYNLSSKPEGTKPYRASEVAKDIIALADHFGAKKFSVVGHDWGGVIAWRVASEYPERIDKLIVINAPHPAIMKRELRNNPRQRRASAYILFMRLPGASRMLSAFDFKRLRPLLDRGVRNGYFDQSDVAAYLRAWSRPGAMRASVAYYKAIDLFAELRSRSTANAHRIVVPTLVIWGERDRYLLPGNLDGLEQFVENLTIHRVPDASHWIVHEEPKLITTLIQDFLSESAGDDQKLRRPLSE